MKPAWLEIDIAASVMTWIFGGAVVAKLAHDYVYARDESTDGAALLAGASAWLLAPLLLALLPYGLWRAVRAIGGAACDLYRTFAPKKNTLPKARAIK